jgi:fucose 4-O-acetylase-like acetyltransferase
MKNVKITGIFKLSAVIICVFLLGFICLIHNGIVDVRINQLGNPFLFLINALSFIIGFFFIFKMIPAFKTIRWLGVNSLAIMCLHLKVQFISYLFLSKFTEGILKCLLVAIVSIILLVPVIFILNRYFPFLVGNKTLKNG